MRRLILCLSIAILGLGAFSTLAAAAVTITALGEPVANQNHRMVNRVEAPCEFETQPALSTELRPVLFVQDPNARWWPWMQASTANRLRWIIPELIIGAQNENGVTFHIQVLVLPTSITTTGYQVNVSGNPQTFFISGGESISSRDMHYLRESVGNQNKSEILRVIRN